uniref:pentatricopeptide repeat-containing protein At2g21090 n=1 Tax=Erigeron canadensis TaxID=72917 RepID=UPI001CB8D71D|nr:pentatricopeptide repeat-containing protein At2g21090 [Erigeron canadensis]XP_043613308.1 pentatricopeptide repeat-containing protein At2g21090 [Erigeron canadensis]
MHSFKYNNNQIARRPCVIQSVLDLCSKGHINDAVNSLQILSSKGLRLDTKSLAFILQKCADHRSVKEGKWVHLHMNVTGRKRPGTFLSNHLIHMYLECGNWVSARKVFDEMSVRNLYSWNNMISGYSKLRMMNPARSLFDRMEEKDVVTWNTMIIGYAQVGECDEAMKFYKVLRMLDIGVNEFSFSGVLTVCVKRKDFWLTRQVHCQVFYVGFLSNVVLCSSVIDCYAKCGEMNDARKLFDEMPNKDILAWTTMVSGYAKWGDMKLARGLFDDMPKKNPISWNAVISGYTRHGLGCEALELFAEMMVKRVKPDQFTFSSALCACASIASIRVGKQIHGFMIRTYFAPNTIVVGSLIDMYSKCGNLELGLRVFKITDCKHNTMLWNTMISALAQHGHGESAMELFSYMVELQVPLDRITFVIVLNACSHSGLVQKGLHFFNTVMHEHNIIPDQEHYACLVDLLGRAGCFDELVNQLTKMPVKPDALVWKALLGVCRLHGNLELGRKAAERLIECEPQLSVGYVLLSGIYAASGKWDSVAKVRKLMNERDVSKDAGINCLENENKFHAFTVSDKSHTSKDEIDSVLEILATQMEKDVSFLDA